MGLLLLAWPRCQGERERTTVLLSFTAGDMLGSHGHTQSRDILIYGHTHLRTHSVYGHTQLRDTADGTGPEGQDEHSINISIHSLNRWVNSPRLWRWSKHYNSLSTIRDTHTYTCIYCDQGVVQYVTTPWLWRTLLTDFASWRRRHLYKVKTCEVASLKSGASVYFTPIPDSTCVGRFASVSP